MFVLPQNMFESHTSVTVYVWLFSTMVVGNGQYVVYLVTTSVTMVAVPLVAVPLVAVPLLWACTEATKAERAQAMIVEKRILIDFGGVWGLGLTIRYYCSVLEY